MLVSGSCFQSVLRTYLRWYFCGSAESWHFRLVQKRVAKTSALVLSSVLIFFLFSLQATAPLYNVKDMTTPTVLFVGAHDVLGDPADAAALKPQISNLIHYEVIPGWNHLDFLYGIDAAKILYPKILYTMEKFE